MRANEFLKEAFDQPYRLIWEKGEYGSYDAYTQLPDGSGLSINFNLESGGPEGMDEEWHVEFWRNQSLAVTGQGDAQRIFATVLAAIADFIEQENPETIVFSASKEVEPGQNPDSRASLYKRFVQRYAQSWGYGVQSQDNGKDVVFRLYRLNESKSVIGEVSRDRLERYLDRANRQVDARQERMARARARLNTSYEIYHSENPSKIVDRFEADTPADAQRYYQDYIEHYESDVDYDLSLRKSTGIGEELEEGIGNWLAGIATVGALLFGSGDVNALTQQQYDQTARILSSTPAQILKQVAIKNGITGNELAQFMAQCAHETAGFSSMKEIGGLRDFKKYDIKHNPRKAKALGNVKPGDGAKYHGRGFIQLTGRDNYKRAGQALGLPLEQKPELVERPDVAAKVAVWFWKSRVQPKVSSYHDTAQVTKPINPAMRGLKDRDTKFQAIKHGAMVRANQLAPRGTKI